MDSIYDSEPGNFKLLNISGTEYNAADFLSNVTNHPLYMEGNLKF